MSTESAVNTLVEAISPDDLARLQFVLSQRSAVELAWEQEQSYLSQRYGLLPDDQIDGQTGRITRTRQNGSD